MRLCFRLNMVIAMMAIIITSSVIVHATDTTPPTWSLNSTNSTVAGADIEHSLYWQDDTGLDAFVFSFCNGMWNGTQCVGYVTAEESYTGINYWNSEPIASSTFYGQTFTVGNLGTNVTYNITAVKIYLYKENSPGNLTVYLRDVNGSGYPTSGPNLASGNLSASEIPTSYTWVTVPMSTYQLDAGTQYALIITADGISINDYIMYVDEFSSTYTGGAFFTSPDSGNTFSYWPQEPSNPTDLIFQVIGNETVASDNAFVNDTPVIFSGTGSWSNVTKTVNSTVGVDVAWKVYAMDTSYNWNMSDTFTYLTTSSSDTIPPTIYITSPTNTTYNSSTIDINVTTSEAADTCIYNFHGGTNYTLFNDSMTNWFTINQTYLDNGTTEHLEVYCNDTAGNLALNDSIWFTYEVDVPSLPSSASCSTCAECTSYLTNGSLATGAKVTLTADITGHSGTCITFNASSDNYTFDCAGHTISGDSSGTDYGIWINDSDNEMVQGCSNVSYFYDGFYIYGKSGSNIYYDSNITVYNSTSILNSLGMDSYMLYSNITDVNMSSNTLYGYSSDIWGYGVNNTFTRVEARYNSVFPGTTSDFYLYSGYNTIKQSVIESLHLIGSYNTVYDNNITSATLSNPGNHFNTTKTLSTNIIGGPYIGGNYWSSYTGTDFNGDGIGDSAFTVSSTYSTYDYLPLFLSGSSGTVTAETSEGNQNWTFSAIQGEQELIDLNFTSTGNISNTIYFTPSGNLSNSSIVSLNSTINLTLGASGITTMNLTINPSCPSGSYSGNLTWASANSSSTGNISIYFTVSNTAADINIVNASWSAAFTAGNTHSFYLYVNNTGNYNASDCNMSYSGSVGTASFDHSDFEINQSEPVSIKVTMSSASTGSGSGIVTCTCSATPIGGTDSDFVSGSISVSAATVVVTGGGGGGGGSTIIIAASGNWTILQSSFYLLSSPGSTLTNYITIYNQESDSISEVSAKCIPSTCRESNPCSCINVCPYVTFQGSPFNDSPITANYTIASGQSGKIPFVINMSNSYASSHGLDGLQSCTYTFSMGIAIGNLSRPIDVNLVVLTGIGALGNGIEWLQGASSVPFINTSIPNWLMVISAIVLSIVVISLIVRHMKRPKRLRWFR